MPRWQVGDAEIVRVEDSNFALPSDVPAPAWAVPDFVAATTELPSAFSTVGVIADGMRIVIDPWLADDNPRDRDDAADHADRLLAELAEAGLPADEVDVVVNTHIDGTGWNSRPTPGGGWVPSFPKARYLFPEGELAALARGEEINGSDGLDILLAAGVVDVLRAPHQVSPSVQLVDAPGHNPGHWAVRVESEGALAIVPGHIILTLLHVADPAVDIGDPDIDAATATRRSILGELAEREGILVTTLVGGPGGGRVHREGGGFRLAATGA